MLTFLIRAFDVGEHTKVLTFGGNAAGQLWFAHGFPANIPRIPTPRDLPAERFLPALITSLERAGHWGDASDLHGFSLCGPVVGGHTCLCLINRGVRSPFVFREGTVLNDGMAATLGSFLAGVARGHRGGTACLTLGTGIGFGCLHWDARGRLMTHDAEAHFLVRGSQRRCACGRVGCFEAAANESALRAYARTVGLDLDSGEEVGPALQQLMEQDPPSARARLASTILRSWEEYLAQGVATVLVTQNLGGNDRQPPALIVLAGGLSSLPDPPRVRDLVLAEFGGDPFVGTNFRVAREDILGNRAGCVGAAAHALAQHLDREVTELMFLETAPAS